MARLGSAHACAMGFASHLGANTPVPTFENGWICRECWCANRESDARCYRCHAPQEDIQPVQVSASVVAKPAEEADDDGATRAAATAGISYCMTCGEVMDADARICS